MSRRTRRRLLPGLVIAAGCHTGPHRASSPPRTVDAATSSAEAKPCEDVPKRFRGYAFAPPQTSVLASVDVTAPDLQQSLAALIEQRHKLPVNVAFAVSQWTWEIPLVVATLARVGIPSTELVYARTTNDIPAWLTPTSCDRSAAVDYGRTAFGLDTRSRADTIIATPQPGSAFAFDMVFFAGDHLALCPAGHADAWLDALITPPPNLGTTPAETRPAAHLSRMAPATVRAVVSNRPVFGPPLPSAHDAIAVWVSASQVHIDATTP